MKKLFSILALILLTNCSGIFKSKPKYLFVQSAKSASFDGKILKLDDASKNVILFSNRPYRIAGHTTNKKFLQLWNSAKNENSFKKDPPNTAISYYDSNGKPDVVVIEISDLKIKNDTISYNAKLLEGKLPKKITDVTLFIDDYVNSACSANPESPACAYAAP